MTNDHADADSQRDALVQAAQTLHGTAVRAQKGEAAYKVKAARLQARVAELEAAQGGGEPPTTEPDDGSAIINAHDYMGRTAEENLTIPRFDWLRANRRPRSKRVGTKIYKANEIHRLEDLEIYATWASCIGFSSDYPNHRQGKLEVSNVGHNMQPGAKQDTKWGERCWSMSQIHRVDCDYTDIPEEHGDYDNPSGSTSSRRCTSSGLGGHSRYICLRNQPTLRPDGTWQYPPNNAVPDAPQTHLIEDCHSRNNNSRAAKGSNDKELFNLGTLEHQATVIMRDCTDVVAFPEQLHTGTGEKLPLGVTGSTSFVRSYGAVVMKTYQDQKPEGITGPHKHPVALAQFENCLWDYTQSNKALMSLNDGERIHFDGCAFIMRDCRQPFVDVDDQLEQGHEPTEEVVIANCLEDGVKLRWTMPDGSQKLFDLGTEGRFVRLTRHGSTVRHEATDYDPAHRAKGMEAALS